MGIYGFEIKEDRLGTYFQNMCVSPQTLEVQNGLSHLCREETTNSCQF